MPQNNTARKKKTTCKQHRSEKSKPWRKLQNQQRFGRSEKHYEWNTNKPFSCTCLNYITVKGKEKKRCKMGWSWVNTKHIQNKCTIQDLQKKNCLHKTTKTGEAKVHITQEYSLLQFGHHELICYNNPLGKKPLWIPIFTSNNRKTVKTALKIEGKKTFLAISEKACNNLINKTHKTYLHLLKANTAKEK